MVQNRSRFGFAILATIRSITAKNAVSEVNRFKEWDEPKTLSTQTSDQPRATGLKLTDSNNCSLLWVRVLGFLRTQVFCCARQFRRRIGVLDRCSLLRVAKRSTYVRRQPHLPISDN